MEKKFRYCSLEERIEHGSWLWFLDGEIVNPTDGLFLGDITYKSLSLVQILNLLGKDGWQAVNIDRSNNYEHTILVMKEYYIGEVE